MLTGGAGDDQIFGHGGNDESFSGSGEDELFWGNGDDKIAREGGADTHDNGDDTGGDKLCDDSYAYGACVDNRDDSIDTTVIEDVGSAYGGDCNDIIRVIGQGSEYGESGVIRCLV